MKGEFPKLKTVPGALLQPKKTANTIRKRVAETIKGYGTIRLAERATYKKFLKDRKENKKSYAPWGDLLRNGKIYIFKYDPILADKLDYYDKNPIVLSLGNKRIKNGVLDLGINLNFLPLRFKLSLLEQIEINKQIIKARSKIVGNSENNSKKQKPNQIINYDWCERFLSHLGYKFALRSYYLDRRSKTLEIAFEEWDNIPLLNIVDLEKLTYQEVMKLFTSYYNEIK